MKLTKRVIDNAKVQPGSQQSFIRDDQLQGFACRVTSTGAKSFVIEKRINGKVKRITLGRYPNLTVESARREAQKLLGKIATGVDPVAEKKADHLKGITLWQVFTDYLRVRKNLKQTTIYDYHRVLDQVLPDWKNKRLIDITKDMVSKRHEKHGLEHSEARANLSMRLLRAIFNFAMAEYDDAAGHAIILENPVKRLSHTRSWYRVERRKTVIKAHELHKWHQGLLKLQDCSRSRNVSLMQDYFLLILFTGLRRHEAASIKWADVDLKAKTFTLHDTKNRSSHTLPLSDFLEDLFLRRKLQAVNEFVFPAEGKTQHLVDPRKTLLKLIELSGVEHTLHDLRRTFITVAESLDIPAYALKSLLNHKMHHDVTAGYIVMDVERLRKPMQAITNKLLALTRSDVSQVIPLIQKDISIDHAM